MPMPATRLTSTPERPHVDVDPGTGPVAGSRIPGAADDSTAGIWPTQTPAWMAAASAHLCAPHDSRTFALGRPQATDGLCAPLTMSVHTPPGRRQPRLTLPGAHVTGEPCDLPQDRAAAMLQALAAQPLALELPRVPADSPTPDAVRRAYAGRALVRIFPAPGAPYIALDDTWAEPLQHFNAGRRSDFRRAEQHARRLGGAHLVFHDDLSGQALESGLDEAFEVEARGWKGQTGSALAQDLPMGRFVRDVARSAARAGALRLAFLRVDGRAAAMQIAVARDQRLWLLKIGYDPAYARCRPGHLLLLQTLARAARQGLRSCEFMGHAAPWTAQWTTTMRDCVGLRVYPMTRPGLRACGEDVADGLIRRLRHAAIRLRAGAAGASRLYGPKAAAAAASTTSAGTASSDAKDSK